MIVKRTINTPIDMVFRTGADINHFSQAILYIINHYQIINHFCQRLNKDWMR